MSLFNNELQNLRHLHHWQSRDQRDRADQNDIPGAAENNGIKALAALEEYETIALPTQQPT